MRTFLAHPCDSDPLGRDRSLKNFAVGRIDADNSFGWRRLGVVINVLRSGETDPHVLKSLGKIRLAKGPGQCRWIAEQ